MTVTGALNVQSSSKIVITNKSISDFLQARCPSCRPTNNVRALKGNLSKRQSKRNLKPVDKPVALEHIKHINWIVLQCQQHVPVNSNRNVQ